MASSPASGLRRQDNGGDWQWLEGRRSHFGEAAGGSLPPSQEELASA
jgi:hypothetical protein